MSNGSESTPERCVHAVDGPDWAGLREPASWKERAIAAEARLDAAEAIIEAARFQITGDPMLYSREEVTAVLLEYTALQTRAEGVTR